VNAQLDYEIPFNGHLENLDVMHFSWQRILLK